MPEAVSLASLVGIGKETMERVTSVEGVGVFSPMLLAEYTDDHVDVALMEGEVEPTILSKALADFVRHGPMRSLSLTTDAWVTDLNSPDPLPTDALIVLYVTMEQAQAVVVPYVPTRSAHCATIAWRDTQKSTPDTTLAMVLWLAVSASRVKLGE